MRTRLALIPACGALALAACGADESPRIPAEAAEPLAARSEAVAAALESGDRCAADRLADELVRASESANVPAPYRRELLASARALAVAIECPPPPPPSATAGDDRDEDEGEEKDEEKGEGKGNGKGKGKGKRKDDG